MTWRLRLLCWCGLVSCWPVWQEHREVLQSGAESYCCMGAVCLLLCSCSLPFLPQVAGLQPPPGHSSIQRTRPHCRSKSPRTSQVKPPLWCWRQQGLTLDTRDCRCCWCCLTPCALCLCFHPVLCVFHLWLFSSQCSSSASIEGQWPRVSHRSSSHTHSSVCTFRRSCYT